MKTETKVLIVSALGGASFWIGDAAVETLLFSKEGFLDELILTVTPHEIYMRTMVFLAALATGLIAAVLLRRARMAREALLESQGRFDAFMAHFPGIAFMRDRDGRFVFVNPVMAGILGKPVAEILGRQAFDILPPEVAAVSLEEDRAILESGRVFRGENLIHHADGLRYWMVNKFPIPDERGGVGLVGGISIDISDAKKAEEALRESEERYRMLFNSMNDGILILDPEGKILEINEVLCQRLQYSRDELLGRGVSDIDSPEFAKIVPERMRSIMKAGSGVFETAHARRDGTAIPTEISTRAITFHGDRAILSIARDITERMAAKKALQEAEELYRTLVENLGEGVGIMDPEETFLFANPAAEAIFGVPAGSLAGRNLREFMSDEELDRAKAGTEQRRQDVTGTFESRIMWPDDTERVLRVTATPKRNLNGEYVATLGVFWDITEAKRTQDALRESEQRYRTILEDMEEGYYEVDLSGNLTFANEAFLDIWGVEWDKMAGRNYRSLMAPENAERTYSAFHRVFKSGMHEWISDWQTIREDGSIRALDTSIYPICTADGRCSGFRGVLRDVTERLAAEKTLRESEERYRDLVEHSVDVILTHDLSGRILSGNPAVAKFFGMDRPEDAVGLDLHDTLVPGARHLFKNYIEAIQRDGRASGIMRVLNRQGEERILAYDNTLKPGLPGDAVVRARGQDVTEKRAMEKALRESEAHFRDLFEHNLAGVYTATLDGRTLDCNAALAAILGFDSPAEVCTHLVTDFYALPEDRGPFVAMLQQKKRLVNHEFRGRRKDGTPFVALGNVSLYRDSSLGEWVQQGTVVDVTDLKRAEESLRRMKDLETMARLSQGMAHEVRNPLFAIQVNVSALVKRLTVGPEAQAHVDHILAHVKRLDDLVRSLMELGDSIDSNEVSNADLRATVEAACAVVRDEFAGRRMGIEIEERQELVSLRTSVRKLTLAFINLLRNAAQVSPEASVVRIACVHEPGACRITLSDQGPGIPEKIRESLFQPFVTTRTGQPGMGLALAKHYVESLGGTIAAQNNDPPPGATFTVRLPLAQQG